MRNSILLLLLLIFVTTLPAQQSLEWPEIHQQTKPWSRWWWMGSAVDESNLSSLMETYKEAGLGGLEITTIYGVRGEEDRFLPYLTPEWNNVFEHTLEEAKRLNLGIDLANASGWPFGGPWVENEDAPKYMEIKTWEVTEGESLAEPVTMTQQPILRVAGRYRPEWSELTDPIYLTPDLQQKALDQVRFEKPLPLVALMAFGEGGKMQDLTDKVQADGSLDWKAPAGSWKLYGMFQGWHGKMVERAGPGGEGNVIDHFSEKATTDYLAHFDKSFEGMDLSQLRGFFNDSYEVDDARGEADWTADFLDEFEARRGYDLRTQLPALEGEGETDIVNRVICDYRETLSDLLLEHYTRVWDAWAAKYGKITRNQSHGSPANILDLYAAVDIPEAEGDDILRFKFASSAAHVMDKPLASSESATWLDQHFRSNLGDVKHAIDKFFLGGINHIFYHGTTYSPEDAAWPGWLFYAAVHFHPSNPWWDQFSALNEYVARCQSFLQQGKADNEILMYFPIHDRWSVPGEYRLQHYDGFKDIPEDWPTQVLAEEMMEKGYSFDFISDRQLEELEVVDGVIAAPGAKYKVIVVPKTEVMPIATFRLLQQLSQEGATVVFEGAFPESTAGLGDFPQKDLEFQALKRGLPMEALSDGEGSRVAGNAGNMIIAPTLDRMMTATGVARETMVDESLQFIRRKLGEEVYYFILNPGEEPYSGEVTLAGNFPHLAMFNPFMEEKGVLDVSEASESGTKVNLSLKPGESVILLSSETSFSGSEYPMYNYTGKELSLDGAVELEFIKGGPVLPKKYNLDSPKPWTSLDDTDANNFSGTGKYIFTFDNPSFDGNVFELDLGEVHESATVILNSEKVATLIGPDFSIRLPTDKLRAKNTLEVLVSNSMANRIAWMDREGMEWKKFYNINVSSRLPEDVGRDGVFTAERWEVMESGLVGPVVVREVVLK